MLLCFSCAFARTQSHDQRVSGCCCSLECWRTARYARWVQPGSRIELFLQNYTDWARPLLVQEDTNALFLNVRGRAFYSDGSFNKYLPRLLAGCAKLSWTKVI